MVLDDNNNVKPLFAKDQTIPGGAGDLMITITGLPGSGFEQCDPTQQTLTRGSQYQTSFLPEMSNGQEYKVKVRATYKDYLPLDFVLTVRYLPNLDGKTKFVDLGTHVFTKANNPRSANAFKFSLHGVTDLKVDDDLDAYTLSLIDSKELEYYKLEEQENVVEISEEDSKAVPRIGSNLAHVSDGTDAFYPSQRQFFDFEGQPTDIEIPLVAKLKEGQLAVVLTWTEGSQVTGDYVELHNLDLHVEFQPSETVKCQVDLTMRQCNGVKLVTDRHSSQDAVKSIQAVKFDQIGDFQYMVYASRSKKTLRKGPSSKNNQIEATI